MQPIPFTLPLFGGALIGLAAGLYLLLAGRIAGISDLAAKATGLADDGFHLKGLGFIAGLVGGGALAAALVRRPDFTIDTPGWLLAVAGLLVGYGARLGSGCTSGHGICGMARLSRRSIVSTLVYMAVAMAVVFLMRHLP